MKKESINYRKQAIRQKIMMGGLVVKSGLAELHQTNPEVILGILVEAKDKLDNPATFTYWKKLGLDVITKKLT